MCDHPDYFLSKYTDITYSATCTQCGEQIYYISTPDVYEMVGEYVFNMIREEEKEVRRTKTKSEEENDEV